MRAHCSLCYILLYFNPVFASRTCYWPDGSVINSSFDYTPCDLTATGLDSACCGSKDPCSDNGYCFGGAGYVYRGGCTDSTWNADECCPTCRNVALNIFSNLIPCQIINGSYTPTFCCSETPGSEVAAAGCCDRAFDINDSPIVFGSTRSAVSALSTLSFSSFATFTVTATVITTTDVSSILSSKPAESTSACVSSVVTASVLRQLPPSKRNFDISVAIGVSLGISLISGLIIFLVHEHKLRIKAQNAVTDTLAAYEVSRARTPTEVYQSRSQMTPEELEDTQPQPGELYGREIYEAGVRI